MNNTKLERHEKEERKKLNEKKCVLETRRKEKWEAGMCEEGKGMECGRKAVTRRIRGGKLNVNPLIHKR